MQYPAKQFLVEGVSLRQILPPFLRLVSACLRQRSVGTIPFRVRFFATLATVIPFIKNRMSHFFALFLESSSAIWQDFVKTYLFVYYVFYAHYKRTVEWLSPLKRSEATSSWISAFQRGSSPSISRFSSSCICSYFTIFFPWGLSGFSTGTVFCMDTLRR